MVATDASDVTQVIIVATTFLAMIPPCADVAMRNHFRIGVSRVVNKTAYSSLEKSEIGAVIVSTIGLERIAIFRRDHVHALGTLP